MSAEIIKILNESMHALLRIDPTLPFWF